MRIAFTILLASFAIVTAGLVTTLAVVVNEEQITITDTPDTIDYAMSQCEYGSTMFYVARDIDPDRAQTLAKTDCANYLATNGEEWMIDAYGINWNNQE